MSKTYCAMPGCRRRPRPGDWLCKTCRMVEPGIAEDATPADQIATLKRELTAERQRVQELEAELSAANRECEVRNERELGYLTRAQSAEAELAAVKEDAARLEAIRRDEFNAAIDAQRQP